MKTFTVSDIVAAAGSPDGWPLFLQLMQAMVDVQQAMLKTTPEDFMLSIGKPGFLSRELDEHRGDQANQAQFEAFAALTDFMNVVTPTKA